LILLSVEKADPSVCGGAASFLQSLFWGRFKARFGWKVFAFSTAWNPLAVRSAVPSAAALPDVPPGPALSGVLPDTPAASPDTPGPPLLVLCRRLGPGIGFAYVPWGPELPSTADCTGPAVRAALEELAAGLKALLPPDTAFIRFDLPWHGEDFAAARKDTRFFGKALRRAAADVQPPDTVIIDLVRGGEEILARMKSKWRYNIGLAGKKGVVVRRAAPEELPSFYRLYRETARRDGIAIHGMDYYQVLFEEGKKPEHEVDVRLYLAGHEGEDIAGIITLFRKNEAVYLYGASANHKRNLMAPYALQWQAIQDAKASLCLFYDLYGIPPDEDPAHPMAGLYRFKTGFGGAIVHRPGCWDYVCKPVVTALYRTAEAARKKLRDAKKRLKKSPQ
jgi:lipid II:glycine glycyltransferase (peptidoglycan interpeptide bridge formation enzyme)